MLLGVTLMVGARTFPLGETEASWLATGLEARWRANPDLSTQAGAQLAEAIQVALDDRSMELLDLGDSQIDPVRSVLCDSARIEESSRLNALDEALRRQQGDPEPGT